jgi:hypothetical protein
MVGGAGAGALYGIGGAGLLVGTMAKSRWVRGLDIVIGLAIFSATGAFVGALYGLVAGLLVGLAVSPVVACFLMRPMVQALPPTTRTRRTQVVAFVTTLGVTALPVLGSAIASGEPCPVDPRNPDGRRPRLRAVRGRARRQPAR